MTGMTIPSLGGCAKPWPPDGGVLLAARPRRSRAQDFAPRPATTSKVRESKNQETRGNPKSGNRVKPQTEVTEVLIWEILAKKHFWLGVCPNLSQSG